jgi:hypothetical protein
VYEAVKWLTEQSVIQRRGKCCWWSMGIISSRWYW